ncbi:hypothetical protein [Methanolobus sp.]|uniref:hypothetical protein n=1 Tax=Methanolobus sp. TaxID=1874737 RepID=UPI0025D046A1|nr:hypothetical protein [Methanolobus sp.]
MLKNKHILIMGIVVLGLIVSGCADNETQGDDIIAENTSDADLSEVDALLSEESIGVTDPEIVQLEAEMAELEALIGEMDAENIVVEEI